MSTFPCRAFLAVERRTAAVRPRNNLRAGVRAVPDDSVVRNSQVVQLVKQFAYHRIVLHHTIGIEADPRLASGFSLEMGPDMHSGCITPDEEWLLLLRRFLDKFLGSVVDFLVDGLHPFAVEWPGVLNFLLSICRGPRMKDSSWSVFLPKLRIFGIVVAFGLFLGVEMIEVTEEFIEPVHRG